MKCDKWYFELQKQIVNNIIFSFAIIATDFGHTVHLYVQIYCIRIFTLCIGLLSAFQKIVVLYIGCFILDLLYKKLYTYEPLFKVSPL